MLTLISTKDPQPHPPQTIAQRATDLLLRSSSRPHYVIDAEPIDSRVIQVTLADFLNTEFQIFITVASSPQEYRKCRGRNHRNRQSILIVDNQRPSHTTRNMLQICGTYHRQGWKDSKQATWNPLCTLLLLKKILADATIHQGIPFLWIVSLSKLLTMPRV